jgi:anti-anti-sigma factor
VALGQACSTRVTKQDGDRAFRLVGDLDASSVCDLVRTMEAHIDGDGDVVLDLADLTSADSRGAAALATIAGGLDGDLILLSPRPSVVEVLRTTRIAELAPNVVVFCTPSPSPFPGSSPAPHETHVMT